MDNALSSERRRRLAARLAPLVALAAAAFAIGLFMGANHEPRERVIAERFLAAWERGEVASMYELLDAGSRARYTVDGLRALYDAAAEAATLTEITRAGPLEQDDIDFTVELEAVTRLFGVVPGTLRFAVATDADDVSGVVFAPRLVFPGLLDGEELERETELPPRAELRSRDGEALPADVAGAVGPIPEDEAARYAELGYPPDATVGLNGLELQFEERLAGKLGGVLRAGARELVSVEPEPAEPLRTSIDLDLQAASTAALAGRLGGIAVTRPRTGEVLAIAGYDCCLPQPPGSIFKIITLAGALETGTVKPGDSFPVETAAVLSGVELQNANGEACGGTLEEAFAESCNSVFAPLGVELGAEQLVETAEAFGFNAESDIPGAPPGSIPPATEIGDDLAVGSSAIGQGQVTANPLRMAEMTGTIANDGLRVTPVFERGATGTTSRAVSKGTARIVTRLMRAVVEYGTGTAAAIAGADIAGKTGTAELRSTVPDPSDPEAFVENDPANTDAWFVAFAPARKPRVVVSVLLVGAGAGGATAAPAARIVLAEALGAS